MTERVQQTHPSEGENRQAKKETYRDVRDWEQTIGNLQLGTEYGKMNAKCILNRTPRTPQRTLSKWKTIPNAR